MELSGLIKAILNLGTGIVKDKLQRHEQVIRLLKTLNLDPEHPPSDFTGVYHYTLVEYGIGKPEPVLEIFRQSEIQKIFRKAFDRNNPAILLKEGEDFLASHILGDELYALKIDTRREFYEFSAIFIEVAKRTRTPAEMLVSHRIESLHQRLNRLPTLESLRIEMARLVERGLLALPASEAREAKQCRAFALSQQMRGWFETLGYRFEKYEVWEDDCFEWIINIPVRNRFDRILVRGIEGEAGLKDVMALRQSVETQQADDGWLVTARRISPAARDEVEKPENRHLDCYTFDELVDLDADFTSYIQWLEAEIEQRGIEAKYVPLACTKEELDPVTKQRIASSRYDEREGWIDGYIDRWLDDSAKEHISVLGEFGTGKTWFAFHYAGVALKQYREAKERGTKRPRLPLVITLRDYAKALNVENVLAGFFFTQHNIRLNSEVFDQLNRMGKLLLIFDGFDEMAAKVDKQQMINNFWEMARVVVPGAKVILTCRTEHFPEAQEGRALLNAELQASTANLTGETPQFEVLELEKFTDDQIRQVLSFQATPETVERVMDNPQLLDLARRPVMAELILEALPDIEAGKPVDMSRVYLYAVQRKMERDIKAERTFTSLADKLYFLCELSWEMLSTDQMSLNYRLFPDRIRKLFGAMVQEEKDLDHWHYDMMGQTMLIRNADGDYTPAHRSLLEFFVAYKFAAELGALAPDFLELAQMQSHLDTSAEPEDYIWSDYFRCDVDAKGEIIPIAPLKNFVSEKFEVLRSGLGMAPFPKAVLDLLVPMLTPFSSTVEHPLMETIERTCQKSETEIGYIGGNAATLLVQMNQSSLSDRDLSRAVIKCADFSKAQIHRTNFRDANLTDCRFTTAFGSIQSVKFSPDGETLATSDSTGQIYLWNMTDRTPILKLGTQQSWLRPLDFSPDGDILASGGETEIRLWNIKTGEYLRSLPGHEGLVRSVRFSSSGRFLASSSEDRTVRIWDVLTGQCLYILEGHTSWVHSVSFSPDETLLATGSSDRTIKLWQVSTGECFNTLLGHADEVRSVDFSRDGKMLASGSDDRTIKLWDISTQQCSKTLCGHTAQIRDVVFSPDGELLSSGGEDQTVRIWNVKTGEYLKILQEHTFVVNTVDFNSKGNILASGGYDATVKLWDVETGECVKTFSGYHNWILSVSFSSDRRFLASGGDDSVVRLWDLCTDKCVRVLAGHTNWVWSVAFSPDNRFVASASEDRTIGLWNIATGECCKIFRGHTNRVRSISFSPNGQFLASSSSDRTVKIWAMDTGECIKTLEGHSRNVDSVVFSPDGRNLATGSADRTIKLWNLKTGECIKTFLEGTDLVLSVAFSPDGKFLVSGGSDRELKMWDINSEQCIKTFTGHAHVIQMVALSPDGKIIASCGYDRLIKLWDVQTGLCSHTLQKHSSAVGAVAFSSDGQILASAGQDGIINFWNANTGEWLKAFQSDRPYEGMNITGVKGLTEAEKATLKALGAIEDTGENFSEPE